MIEDAKVVNGYWNAVAHTSEELLRELGQDLISEVLGDLRSKQFGAQLPKFIPLLKLTDTIEGAFKRVGQMIRMYRSYVQLRAYAEAYNLPQLTAINAQQWAAFAQEMRQLQKLYDDLKDRLVQAECQKFDQEAGGYPRTTHFPGLPVNYYLRGY